MVQLARTREVALSIDRLFEVTIEAYACSTCKLRLGVGWLRFLVIRSREMIIRVEENRHGSTELAYRIPTFQDGIERRFLTKIESFLSRTVFLNDEDMDRYVRENIRFRLTSTNFPEENLVEIDSQTGKFVFIFIYFFLSNLSKNE